MNEAGIVSTIVPVVHSDLTPQWGVGRKQNVLKVEWGHLNRSSNIDHLSAQEVAVKLKETYQNFLSLQTSMVLYLPVNFQIFYITNIDKGG